MRKHIFSLCLLLATAFAAQPASAFQYWALSTHPCTVTDCDGEELNFDRQNQGGEYYHIFNGVDYGATDLNIYETGEQSTITANEPQGFRFKGWWPKAGGDCIETNKTISGAKIKTAGMWNSRPTIVAKYVPIYEITATANPTEAGTVTGGGTYEEGAKAVLTARANAGWAFEKWSDGVTTNPRTIADIREAAAYAASFVPTHKTITFEKTGGTGGTDSVVVTNGQPLVKIKPPTRTGYDFQGYFTAATGDDATQYYTSSGAGSRSWSADETTSVLYARWTGKTFNVKFYNDGATSGPNPLSVTYGKDPGPLNIVPAKDDYTFVGYYLGTACYWNGKGEWVGGSSWTYIPAEGNDVTLTAKYTAVKYTVSFDANGGSGSSEDKSVAVDEEFALPDGTAYSKERHRFAGWALSAGGQKIYDAGVKTTVKDNKSAASQNPNRLTFYAVWTDLSCTVRFNGGSSEATVQPTEKHVEAGGAFGDLATATWAGNRCSLASWVTAGGDVVTAESIVPMGQSVIDLFARWTTNSYSVAFHANGGTGAMGSQVVPFYTNIALSPNLFVRDGYQFAGWATNATDAVVYADGATVRDLASTKDAVADLYAKWTANDYQVVFYGNGGTNTMAAQAFEYDVEQALSSNRFVRADFTFAGWATDPTNAVTYGKGEKVVNLTSVANGVVPLYAKWTANGSNIDSELSAAIGCDSINLTTNVFGWAIAPGEGEGGKTALRTNAGAFKTDDEHFLDATLVGKGTMRFRCKTSINADPVFQSKWHGIPSEFGFYVEGNLNEEEMPAKTNKSEWAEYKYDKKTDGSETISWAIVVRNENHEHDHVEYGSCGSDDDYALIDFVRWEPAVTNATTVGVTFRDAAGGVFDNVTRKAGEAYGELPVPTDPLGREFVNWECEGKAIDGGWIVPAVAAGVEVLSRWGEIPVVTNAVPTAVAGLVYDGSKKTGVPADEGYTIVGNVATNAGDYTAIATPTEYHVWEGGFAGSTNIAWTIAKATYDMSGVTFKSATYEYDGKPHSIAAAGVPDGVEVVYSGDATNRTDVGTNTVTASFKVLDEANYEPIAKTLTAKLIITPKDDPGPGPDPEPVVTNAVPTAIAGLVYDGTERLGVASGANYTIVGNVGTNAGDYVAKATVTNGVWEGGATGATNIAWTIAKATVDMSGVSFASATYEWDGAEHSIAVAGVPDGVEVVYSGDATNRTEIGTNTVTASFTVLDELNYNAITNRLTATLAIVEPPPPPPPPDPTVAYENIYFKATLAELGAEAVPTNRKITIKAEGLPKGLKLVTTALKDARNKATGHYAYTVEGAPTETMDGLSRMAYVRVTDDKVQTLYALDLSVLWAKAHEDKSFPDGEAKSKYANFSVTNLWPDIAKNPKNWTFSGWPSGIKYATKAVTSRKKVDGVYVTVTNARPYEIYGTPTKAGRFTVKAVEKIVGTSYKSTHVATFAVWPQDEIGEEWTDQAYVGVYRKSAESVKSASGLPTGIKFTAKDIVSKNVVTTEAHHFYGTPTKAGTYAVTLTHEDKSKTQFLWTITPAVAPTFGLELTESEVDPVTAKATVRVGVSYDWVIDCTSNATVTASGLPTGLKLVKTAIKSGTKTVGYAYSVAGVPTKAGEFFTTFTTKLNGVSTVTTAAFTVLDLPAWAQGTFDGGVGASEASPGGQATLTVSKAGKLSGKWMSLGTNWTLSATSYDRYDEASESYVAQMIGKTGSGKTAALFTNELTVAEDGLGGIATNDLFIAYQNNWKLEPWKTVGKAFSKAKELVFVPEGYETNDTVSLKFATSGKVTVKDKFVKSVSDKGKITWYSVSGSAVLCPQTVPDDADSSFGGYVFVYLPPKAKTPLEDGGYAVRVPVVWDGTKFDIWKSDDE